MQNCYRSNKIPRELQSEQEERLSNKHIQTLKFLQEIVEENKQLKAKVEEYEGKFSQCAELHEFAENAKEKIKRIQEEYLGRADEINAILTEKHNLEIVDQVNRHMEEEKLWAEQKEKYEVEIIGLKKNILDLKNSLDGCSHHEHQIRLLELKVAAQTQELERLTSVNQTLKQTEAQYLQEINQLKNQENKCRSLKDEVKALVQTNTELNKIIKRLESELENKNANAPNAEQEQVISSLKAKIDRLCKELKEKEDKEKDYMKSNESLTHEVSTLKEALSDLDRSKHSILEKFNLLAKEVDKLRKELSMKNRQSEKETFKEYVQLKREVQVLREENEELKSKLKVNKSGSHLPSIKSNEKFKVVPSYAFKPS